ncbi:hypothetical protein F5882DRAFT_392024 [Hyaloscypha sp. PMI_1271]|nr:hypothetical protein F5882DRAFT_392024 [Hyaloscypha sp. PMI_1271]
MYFVELEVVLVVFHPVIFVVVLFHFCVRVEAEVGVHFSGVLVAVLVGRLVKPPFSFWNLAVIGGFAEGLFLRSPIGNNYGTYSGHREVGFKFHVMAIHFSARLLLTTR